MRPETRKQAKIIYKLAIIYVTTTDQNENQFKTNMYVRRTN